MIFIAMVRFLMMRAGELIKSPHSPIALQVSVGGGDRMGSNGNFSQDPWTRYIPRVETERGDVFQST